MTLILRADGGSRGNPGISGAGFALFDSDGNVVKADHLALGERTCNVAEYYGLIGGLVLARRFWGWSVDLTVEMDSSLVINQMTGAWKIKAEHLKPLNQKAKELADRLRSVEYRWIPREQNSVADKQANLAMDEQEIV